MCKLMFLVDFILLLFNNMEIVFVLGILLLIIWFIGIYYLLIFFIYKISDNFNNFNDDFLNIGINFEILEGCEVYI